MNYQKIAEDFARIKIPELMELSFGCAIKVPNKNVQKQLIHRYCGKDAYQKETYISLEDDGECYKRGEDMLPPACGIEIIGHPIQLQHWLRLLQQRPAVLREPTISGLYGDILCVKFKDGAYINFDLIKGEPDRESDWKALCEVLGLV